MGKREEIEARKIAKDALKEKEKEQRALVLSEYPLYFMEFNRAQKRVSGQRNVKGQTPRRLLFEAGNKVGKCLTYQSLIDTPHGKIAVGELYDKGEPFDVYAWDGEKKIVAKASSPRKKDGLHQCYRITMSDGQMVEAADYHRVLFSDGQWRHVQHLYESFQARQVSNETPLLVDGNNIATIKPITCQEVYDFEVEKYHNYFAGGLIHHNTEWGIAEDISHAIGYRIWLEPSDPDYKINIKVPNMGLIGCETMMHSVPEKIEPTLRRLIPKHCHPVFRLNPQGVVKTITITNGWNGEKCGSVIHVRSYDQRPDTFEGIDFDWIHWDEPPPKNILQAAERGKIVTNAPSWFTMTPLKEPYIYDEFSLRSYCNGGDDDEIGVVRGSVWDNCRDYCKPCDLAVPENENERVLTKCPKCKETMGFIPYAGIVEYLKTLDPDEREAREHGIWHHLSGLVYKEISREKHLYDDFPIPKNWMMIEAVDPHDARPVHWLFGAVSPEEIEINGKKKNRVYWYDYSLLKGDLDDIVRQVKAKRALHGYETPAFVKLDKKFGEKTQMEEKSWHTELEKRGIRRIKLSQSSPGDVELGHKRVKEYLKPQYSTLIGEAKPGMLFAKNACTGPNSPFQAMMNYQYKENTDRPEETYKDWCDCVRYGVDDEPSYHEPEGDKKVIDMLKERNERSMGTRRMQIYAHN